MKEVGVCAGVSCLCFCSGPTSRVQVGAGKGRADLRYLNLP